MVDFRYTAGMQDPSPGNQQWRKGRGATSSPVPRYLSAQHQAIDDGWDGIEQEPARQTTVTLDHPRSIISRNRSPDIPFDQSINPYRGCEHGCVYCYARPTHAYLDLSPGLDFETRLYAKPDADRLLRQELAHPGYRCRPIALGTNTDPYQPIERRLQITRRIIELLHDCDHPLLITTKSSLIERDLDLLAPMAARGLVQACISITTLDVELARRLEPRATAPRRRLQTLRQLHHAGVPNGVLFAPVIPALNDVELERVLEAAAAHEAQSAGYIMLRLPHELRAMFRSWLQLHRPLAADRIWRQIQEIRQGRENDPRFGSRMSGSGVFADLIRQRFRASCKRLGLSRPEQQRQQLDCSRFQPPALSVPGKHQEDTQLSLFSMK